MRISDWSSDVCSSDLCGLSLDTEPADAPVRQDDPALGVEGPSPTPRLLDLTLQRIAVLVVDLCEQRANGWLCVDSEAQHAPTVVSHPNLVAVPPPEAEVGCAGRQPHAVLAFHQACFGQAPTPTLGEQCEDQQGLQHQERGEDENLLPVLVPDRGAPVPNYGAVRTSGGIEAPLLQGRPIDTKIGRASCRERVCQYV